MRLYFIIYFLFHSLLRFLRISYFSHAAFNLRLSVLFAHSHWLGEREGVQASQAELSALRLERFGMCHTGGQFNAYACLFCCNHDVVCMGNAVLAVLLKVSHIIVHYYCFEYCLLLLT